jgi:hypothetical protein
LVIGLLIGGAIIILILLIMLFSRGTAPPPPPKAEAPAPSPVVVTPPAPPTAPAPAPPAPAPDLPTPAAELKEQLQTVFSNMREAQVHKDIYQFMNCYSLTYSNLDDKRRSTLSNWEKYDYTNLAFTIDAIQPIDADNVNVRVTWYMDTRNRRTQELASATQTFQVRFAKELGQWRIRSLEEAE